MEPLPAARCRGWLHRPSPRESRHGGYIAPRARAPRWDVSQWASAETRRRRRRCGDATFGAAQVTRRVRRVATTRRKYAPNADGPEAHVSRGVGRCRRRNTLYVRPIDRFCSQSWIPRPLQHHGPIIFDAANPPPFGYANPGCVCLVERETCRNTIRGSKCVTTIGRRRGTNATTHLYGLELASNAPLCMYTPYTHPTHHMAFMLGYLSI
jgi:hypothetical protein